VSGGAGEASHVAAAASGPAVRACDRCLTRAWLIGRLAGHLEPVRRRIDSALALPDGELVAAVGGSERGRIESELERLDPDAERERVAAAGIEAICRCDPAYPERLRELEAVPAVLHVAGGLERLLARVGEDPVAVVGARRASPYGLEVARSMGRGLAAAGVTVLSGMALGVDSAAHAGALEAGAATVAVLPGPAERPYPPGRRALHRTILATGAAVSELPPGTGVWRWTFPARNRVIAALGAMTVVVEAGERSGALLTARRARELGRPVGAVPGRVTSSQAAGTNGLLAAGARVIRGPQDVLDHLFGVGARDAQRDRRRELPPELRGLLEAVAAGQDTPAALARAGFEPDDGLAALASLELDGYVRRAPGGRFVVVP
jgi:DNA processing protein